jgi:hypothetical protein
MSPHDTPAGLRRGGVFYGWRIVGALAITETVSYGVLYYSFGVFLVPMQDDLGFSRRR